MYYDRMGNLKAVGYEALKDELAEVAMSEQWVKLEWSVIDDSIRSSLHTNVWRQVETSPPSKTSLLRTHQGRRHPAPSTGQIYCPCFDRFHQIPFPVRRNLHSGIVPQISMAVGQGGDPVHLYASQWLGGRAAATDSTCNRPCWACP